ncbi:MAG: membrane protein insertion efficiency factor YidD [Clostridia bacterium]|nr:membrane protein insertion efficiency factor YidD [Clostridia bacterium]
MKRVLLALLRFYKREISPCLPNACKYTPTCSEYAMEAIELHGAFKGSLLAAWRLLRCNPFSRGGYDPVPKPHHK